MQLFDYVKFGFQFDYTYSLISQTFFYLNEAPDL